MWGKPIQVANQLAKLTWQNAVLAGLLTPRVSVDNFPECHLAMVLFSDLAKMAHQSGSEKEFAWRLNGYLPRFVKGVESSPIAMADWHAAIQNLGIYLEPHFGRLIARAIDDVVTYFVGGIMLLCGSESRVLVGVRHGELVWKKVRKIAPHEVENALANTLISSYGVLRAVGPAEVWMVPDFRELDRTAKTLHETGVGYREVCEDLIERAFYGQRYALDPEGVFVQVEGAEAGVTGVYLKVLPDEKSLVNILARIETQNGAIFMVVAESLLIEGEESGFIFSKGGSYFDYLVCQLYHDLVTVVDASIAETDSEGNVTRMPSTPRQEGKPSGTVLPRRVRGQVRSPRSEAPSPTSVKEPVSVIGHPRKVPMTPQHRQVLEQFEAETGLRILDSLKPGETFVRPHFSPKLSNKEVRGLPRFIRYRMQKRLDESLNRKDE